MIQSSIFKSYDIRGIYPKDLNEDAAYHIGKAFIAHTKATNVVVAHDARVSSPALFKALTEGLTVAGAKVTSIGQLPTECLYFALGNYDFDAGIMITASHNPKEYNGFKMQVKRDGRIEWVRGKDLIASVQEGQRDGKEVTISKKEILSDYINFVSKFRPENTKPLRVVVDTSNGVMGRVMTEMKHSLPIEIIELNFEPDGNFPNHSPNPLEKGAADQIRKAIKQQHADFGFIFDADADRLFLVDEQGNLVSSDVTRLLLAKYFLKKNPGGVVVYDLIASKAIPKFILQWGGVPVKAPVGFVNVREELMKHHGVMGGEVSGHYCFKDFFYMDSGMIAFLTLLGTLSQESKKISQLAQELSPYATSPVINFHVDNQEEVLNNVKEKYSDGTQDFLDGVTVEYEDWWFNLRPSNTEPLIKLTIEADNEKLLSKKKKELTKFLQSWEK